MPRGWAKADGRLLAISQYSALFSLFGTNYGGDGESTFALPDLRGRSIIGSGNGAGLSNRVIGERAGNETVTLTTAQIPSHNHDYNFVVKEGRGVKTDATGSSIAEAGIYRDNGASTTLSSQSTNNTGSNQAHPNMHPYLVVTYCVLLNGLYPSES